MVKPSRLPAVILVVYLSGTTCLLLLPVSAPAGAPTYLDKVAHVVLMGLLALVVWWNLHLPRGGRAIVSMFLTLTYAGLIEVLQGFTSFRTREFADVVAGGGGALLAVAILLAISRRHPWSRYPTREPRHPPRGDRAG